MIKKIRSQSKSKNKRLIPFKNVKMANPWESSLSDEDVDEEEEFKEEDIEITDQNDDESTDDNIFDNMQNIEIPHYKNKKHITIVLVKDKDENFLAIHYGFKGYTYGKEHFYKLNYYSTFSTMIKVIQNYANGFYPFEIDKLTYQNFFESFKSEMLLTEKNKEGKNTTNRHFLNYYIRFWDGVDVKLSSLTFKGRPNYEKLALTIFRIGLGVSNDMKKKFLDLIPNHCKDGKLQKSVAVLEVMNEIFERGLGRESGFPRDEFLEYLNKNSEFLKIIDLGGKNGKD